MFNYTEEINITDEDIEYFNSNLQAINNIDVLISQLEVERANELLNAFSFLSNIENENPTIDLLNDQISKVSDFSDSIHNSETSPFNPIIKYCKDNQLVYGYYKNMYDAKMQLENLQGLSVSNIDSAIDYIALVLNTQDSFNTWFKTNNIIPDKFCKALKITNNFISSNISENATESDKKRIDLANEVLNDFQSKIMDCPVLSDQSFAPYTLFGSYLLDPINAQLFSDYFKSFTQKYFDCILIRCCNGKKIIDFYQAQRHTNTIKSFKPLIKEDLLLYEVYHRESIIKNYYEKVVDTVAQELIPLLTHKFRKAYNINYNIFTGSTFEDLYQYEINYLIDYAKRSIEAIKKENLFAFINVRKYIKDVPNEVKDTLKAKFNELKNSIMEQKKNPDRYKQLVHLSNTISSLNAKFNYNFNEYKDEILRYAENEGMKSMPFKDNFMDILDNQGQVMNTIIDTFSKFLSNFVIYDPNFPISENQRDYIYQFTHGFLQCFYTNWKNKLNILKTEIKDEAISCCIKYVICLYSGFKFYPTSDKIESESLYDKYQPKISADEELIYSNYEALNHNYNNNSISLPKRNCYYDLLNILNTFPKDQIEKEWQRL